MQATSPPLKAYIITGLSGAGKSTALQVFEDLGYFTVDGLPIALIQEMVELMQRESMQHFQGIALGISLHSSTLAEDMSHVMQSICTQNIEPCIIYLESQEAELMRRYATTRRPHPLERSGIGLESAIESEKRHLMPLKRMADMVIDTSQFSIHDLRRALQERWGGTGKSLHKLKINIVSFGFKYGIPKEADFVFDLRFLPNPYFDAELRPLSGKDAVIADYVFGKAPEQKFLKKFVEFMLQTIELIESEGRYRLTLAIGCTGGRHRSVAAAEHLRKVIKQAGYATALEHRHLALFEAHDQLKLL